MLSLIFSLTLEGRSATGPYREEEVKAAFLYHFAQFTEWPGFVFSAPASPFIISFLGDPLLGDAVLAISEKRVGAHNLKIREADSENDIQGSHILFIGAAAERSVEELLQRLKGSPILTVSDMDGFAERGGMIGLFTQDRKIRFDINAEAIRKADLKVSSKLMRLARTVFGNGEK